MPCAVSERPSSFPAGDRCSSGFGQVPYETHGSKQRAHVESETGQDILHRVTVGSVFLGEEAARGRSKDYMQETAFPNIF